MKRIILSVLLFLIFSVSVFAFPSYMGGYPDGTFRPDNTITRAEAATVMARLIASDIPEKDTSFSDVNSHWSKNYVAYLEEKGMLDYYKDKFLPDKAITRDEFVALALRVFNLE